ncbi:MAG TPA: amino acid racemase [Rhodocyclaceae bacterium]
MDGFLGIVGGMGPLATADFLKKLVEATPAQCDQEHIPVLLYGDCTVPDRTAYIVGKGPSPLPKLLTGIRFLNDAGVRAICVPCNTSHSWFDELQAASKVPLIHIVDACARAVRRAHPDARRVGVLSTEGVHRTRVYADSLQRLGFEPLCPTPDEFARWVSPGIAHVKAGRPGDAAPLFRAATASLVERGAESVVLGCTEIPLGMERQRAETPSLFVDSTEALARAVVDFFQAERTA